MKLMKRHPHSDLFDMLDETDEKVFEKLVDDISKNGLRYPIEYVEIDGEKLLVDGRNRELACQKAGVEPRYKKLPDGIDVLSYVNSANVHRRHMTKTRLALVCVELEKRFKAENEERRREGGKMGGEKAGRSRPNRVAADLRQPYQRDKSTNTLVRAANALGVSPRMATKAKRVVKNAPTEIIEAIKREIVSVDDAEKIALLSHDDQRDLLRKVRSKEATTLASAAFRADVPSRADNIRKRAEEKRVEVRRLAAEGLSPVEIDEKTGYGASFITGVVPGKRRAGGVLFKAIMNAEVMAKTWMVRSEVFLPEWASAPRADKEKFIEALSTSCVAARKLIKCFKQSMEIDDDATQ